MINYADITRPHIFDIALLGPSPGLRLNGALRLQADWTTIINFSDKIENKPLLTSNKTCYISDKNPLIYVT